MEKYPLMTDPETLKFMRNALEEDIKKGILILGADLAIAIILFRLLGPYTLIITVPVTIGFIHYSIEEVKGYIEIRRKMRTLIGE